VAGSAAGPAVTWTNATSKPSRRSHGAGVKVKADGFMGLIKPEPRKAMMKPERKIVKLV
jgi:hypothetical protein